MNTIKSKTISIVVGNGECCSCGICAGVCPKQSIQMKRNRKGGLFPFVDSETCVNCGLCVEICPGHHMIQATLTKDAFSKQALWGEVRESFIASVKDEETLKISTSGGVCTKLVQQLLNRQMYDVAFLVEGFNYASYITTKAYTASQLGEAANTAKSRYIPVSHENALRYILSHRNERIILVGTSCAIQGFRGSIDKFGLNSANYLLLGLFCDKTMDYGVWNYFERIYSRDASPLQELIFRTKESSGYPGDVKLVFPERSIILDKAERVKIKDFFCVERCLYCLDKLNTGADVALGDNYTKKSVHTLGSNAVVVRTKQGKVAIQAIRDLLTLQPVDMEEISRSQELTKHKENFLFARFRFGGKTNLPLTDWAKCKLKYGYKRVKIRSANKWYMSILVRLDRLLKG